MKPVVPAMLFGFLAVAVAASCRETVATVPVVVENDQETAVPAREHIPLSPESVEFVRGIVLFLLPQSFEDTDDWGAETRIQSGLNVELDRGLLRTNRRWKSVNHGSWKQAAGQLIEPEKHFQLQVARIPGDDPSVTEYQITANARLLVSGRQQQWSYGVMLWSVSAEADLEISLAATVALKQEVVQTEGVTKLRLVPTVASAGAKVERYRLRRISHATGPAVREFGSWFESLIDRRVKNESQQLPAKINRKLGKHPERLEIPVWFGRK